MNTQYRQGYNNRGNGYGYGNNSYNRGGYNNSNRNNAPKKHSGAKSKKYTPTQGKNAGKSQIITNGWMFRRGVGLVTYKCNTTSASQLTEKGWIGSIACEVVNRAAGQKSFYWGTMEASTGKVVINDLGIVISPKGGKGGYTGPFNQ